MNEVVIYSNDLNELILRGFTDAELKLFFAICSRLKDHGSEEVRFSYAYLREITNEKKHYTQKDYADVIQSMYHKLIGLRFIYKSDEVEGEVNLFQGYERHLTDTSFSISVTPKFEYLFNELQGSFTVWKLDEFVNLPGIYPKQLYRLLKQWRRVGHASYRWEDFKLLLDVPETYETKNITRRVVKPAVEKLRQLPAFWNLEYTYSYAGKKVIRIQFDWMPELKPQPPVRHKKTTTELIHDVFNS